MSANMRFAISNSGALTRQNTNEVLHGDIIPSIVNFYLCSVQIQLVVFAVKDLARERVPGIASHVIRQHENNVAIRNSQALDGTIERQSIRHVPVVEPISRRARQHRPIAAVARFATYM
jgi:hypothetical protein